MDTPGVITRTVDDARHIIAAISGHDPRDSTSAQHAPPLIFNNNTNTRSTSSTASTTSNNNKPLAGVTIGIPKEYHVAELPSEITRLWYGAAEWYRAAGANVVSVSLPHTSLALPTYYILAPAEATSNLSRYEGAKYGYSVDISKAASLNGLYTANRSEAFGEEVQRRILLGSWLLSSK
jgi:aspartyl-tRNA(Asn)/glutamyl-tRNA(Gln) amidotransferase subunit A